VSSATKRDAMLEHILAEYQVMLPDMQSSTLERRISDPDLPEGLKELLRVRLQATTTSVTKYKALVNATTGGRLRGTLQFNGAGRTGRWAGRTFQPQNLSRVPKYLKKQWEDAVLAIKSGVVDLVYDNAMEVMGSLVRGCIIAPPGRKLVVSDLSNIEGRVLAWLAGESWKLQAFRDFDAGLGADLYKLAYAKAFGIHPDEVDDGDMRQVGKVMELALGYEGGVGAFLTFAAVYGIDLEALAEVAWATIPAHILEEAEGFYAWAVKQKRSTFGLSEKAFVVCDSLKRMWREAHHSTASFWKELQAACIDATENPGVTIQCRKLKVRRDGAWLRIALPSGRALCYPYPQVRDGKLSYMGMNQYTRQWQRLGTYGGKLVENVTQAVARDIIAANMPAAEAAGYEIVLTVHDEDITETPDTPEFNPDGLAAIMSTRPAWAPDLPLAAAGFEGRRYRKD
jgi:DNA polymerase